MWKAFRLTAIVFVVILGLCAYLWTTAQQPVQRARAQVLRIAVERGIAVAQLTRFAGERVVWTAIGTEGTTPVLLMIADDRIERIPMEQTISEAHMRRRIADIAPHARIVRLVRGVFLGQWVWEAWVQRGDTHEYVLASLLDGRWLQTWVVSGK